MNESKNRNYVVKLCVAALMAALVALSAKFLQVKIPFPLGTIRVHLGNAFCALSGLLLGPWWGGLASGLGSIIFDLTDPQYIAECPITFITKGLYGVIPGLIYYKGFKGKQSYTPQLIAALVAAVYYAIIYLVKNYFYNGLLIQGLDSAGAWSLVVAKIPATVFNGAVAVVFAPIMGLAIVKALKSAHLDRVLA